MRESGWESGSDGEKNRATAQENDAAVQFGRKFGLGCFTFIVGGFSGGMVAVLIGMILEGLKKSPRCEGLPVCNWYVYVGVGAVIGAASLPTLILYRLRRR